jgi:hypothetical protein
MPNVKKSKSMDKMPARRMPEGVEFPKTKKPMPKVEGAKPSVKKPMPKVGPKPARMTPKPKTTKKSPGKMTPQDAAMKKILEKKYGKIYG